MRLAVIVEVDYRKLLGESKQSPNVIAMIMGCPHVIDLLQAGDLQRIDDATEIAIAGVAGIDKQRLAGGSNEERGLASLGIDVIDVQGSGRGLGQQANDSYRQTEQRHEGSAHIWTPSARHFIWPQAAT